MFVKVSALCNKCKIIASEKSLVAEKIDKEYI